MPVYAQPSLPEGLGEAIEALGGNAARVAVLSFLVEHPDSRVGEIAEATGLAGTTVKMHVSALLELGTIVVDPPLSIPYEDRRGQHARYALNAGRLRESYARLGSALGFDELPSSGGVMEGAR